VTTEGQTLRLKQSIDSTSDDVTYRPGWRNAPLLDNALATLKCDL
jgi:hypothetical protein